MKEKGRRRNNNKEDIMEVLNDYFIELELDMDEKKRQPASYLRRPFIIEVGAFMCQ